MIGTPASRWPLCLRRLACRFLGCTMVKAVKYDGRRRVLVGLGCTRCEAGTVKDYAMKGPIPAAVKEHLAAGGFVDVIPRGKD